MSEVLIIFFSYILGSIPFGYIFSKIAGKDILKIGWRKTSGSNVFRYVGFWPGLATGLADVGKGFLALYLTQKFGFSSLIQIFAGLAVIVGHNWSLFLRFAGGRGIGTFIGVFIVLSPKILILSLIPFFLLALIWNASIGTILFLISAFGLSIYFNQIILTLFVFLSFFPIFIKRLSPIGELALTKKRLIKNRLIFDDDFPHFDLRIKRIIKKLTKS